jgi:hypothetical protein
VTDSNGGVARPVDIALAISGKPAIATPASETLTSGVAKAVAGVKLSEVDTTAGETFTVKLGDAKGLLTATGAGVTGSGTRRLIITGVLAKVNAALATLKDVASTAGSNAIEVTATDSNGGAATAAKIAVAVSGKPAISAPASVALSAGVARSITGLRVTEADATTGETFTVTLTDTSGVLTATGAGVTGSGTKTLTLVGAISRVNADLEAVKDTEAKAGSDTVRLTAADSNGGGATAASIGVITSATPVAGTSATVQLFGQWATGLASGDAHQAGTPASRPLHADWPILAAPLRGQGACQA